MKYFGKLFLTAVAVFFVLGVSALSYTRIMQPPELPNAIVRLHDDSGRFFCSGTVISDLFLVTAAHCLVDTPKGTKIEIRGSDALPTGIYSTLWAYNERADIGIMKMDGTKFQHMKLEINTDSIVHSFTKSDNLILCGYPWAGQLYCGPYKFVHQEYSHMAGTAHAWPGMSGGPVIDIEKNVVIATLYGIDEQGAILVNPTIEIWRMLRNK
jgi:V8-like Glu-specific endopeptidase